MEDWRDIDGYQYQVSSLGRIRRLLKGKVRAKAPTVWGGYHYVNLYNRGVCTPMAVHSLVAELFIGPRPSALIINHKDGNKLNNAVTNLEYVTYSENTLHSYRLGLQKPASGESNGRSKLTKEQVASLRLMYSTGMYTHRELGAKYGVTPSAVSRAISGARWATV